MTTRPSRLSDRDLTHALYAAVDREQRNTAFLLSRIAEAEARQLHVSAGYGSMEAFCVHELGMDEEEVPQRIRAARFGRRFPEILHAMSQGRLHIDDVLLIAPHLTPTNDADLISAASFRTKTEIEELIAQRFGGWEPDPPMRS